MNGSIYPPLTEAVLIARNEGRFGDALDLVAEAVGARGVIVQSEAQAIESTLRGIATDWREQRGKE